MGLSQAVVGRDLAIDLGTANTLVYARGRGVVVDEPSIVSVDMRTGSLVSAGGGAKEILGRAPRSLTTVRPLTAGLISDFDATEGMLRYFLNLANPRASLARPRVLICVPSGTTNVEQRTVEDAGYSAGARKVFLLEEPMAAAIGAGLDIFDSQAKLIVDIGGGTTEVAVISRGDIVNSISAPMGGDQYDVAVADYLRSEYGLALGESTSERIKIELGSVAPQTTEPTAEISGRDLETGLPCTVTVAAAEIREALAEPLRQTLAVVRRTLDETPPEFSADIIEHGLVLSGGGALLRGLPTVVTEETGIKSRVAFDPLRCVVTGAGQCVDDLSGLDSILLSRPRRRL
ncbi:MAG: rod shape-determining protein [Actinomycetia bacterium]|nr:rod shape-determining protein [Actinomycetes bacterium]